MAYISPEDHQRIRAAVAAAENRSTGEIVTIVADRSDGYSDIAFAWAALASFLILTVLPFVAAPVLDWLSIFHGGWNVEWQAPGIFGAAAAIGIVTFLLVLLVQLWTPVRFALVPRNIRAARTEDRAIELFKVSAEQRTKGRTGILIYLSMREHCAEIIADEAIAGQVAPEAWGEAMASMLAELKQGRIADGMIAAINGVSTVLAEHLPSGHDSPNELPDRLIEL